MWSIFSVATRNLVVEVDGGQHAESQRDKLRDAFLLSEGYRVLRFWNSSLNSPPN